MNDFDDFFFAQSSGSRGRHAARLPRRLTDGDFTCKHCRSAVFFNPLLSGVQNRNHCPYCLWSRHLDLYSPGDRLAACRGAMRPVALSLKRVRRRYAGPNQGELMLVHVCDECARISINRIAADDLPHVLEEVFNHSLRLPAGLRVRLESEGIAVLAGADRELVLARLYGKVNTNIIQNVCIMSE